MRKLILKLLGIEGRIAALESRQPTITNETHKHYHNPAQTWLDSLPKSATCFHCEIESERYCFDGYGRTVCENCKPQHYADAARRGVAKGV